MLLNVDGVAVHLVSRAARSTELSAMQDNVLL
jgi:hypothetical protein